MGRLTTDQLKASRLAQAKGLLTAFFVLLKTARTHSKDNDAYRRQSTRFFEMLLRYLDDRNSCAVKIIQGRLFVDDQLINFEMFDSDDKIGARQVIDHWTDLGIGGIIFGDLTTKEHIDVFIHLLANFSFKGGDPFDRVASQLADSGVDTISLLAARVLAKNTSLSKEERIVMRQKARETFFRSMATVREIVSRAKAGKTLPVNRARQVVHAIIDQLSQDQAALIELTCIKDFDEYTYAHSTNVCIYALTLGFRLGLSRKELSELGFAALFHDIGKIKLPHDLITKPERFNENDWTQMRRHPLYGAMTIAKMLRFDSNSASAMAVALEHHINTDHTGYPSLPEKRPTNLYSRIIAITDSFDALTSGRVYIKEPIPPHEVLRKLLYQMTVKFDPFLLRLFVCIIGAYPLGTLVLLSNQALAIVSAANPDDCHRPVVRVIADVNGEKESAEWLDLVEAENSGIDILRMVDPTAHKIDITKYILQD